MTDPFLTSAARRYVTRLTKAVAPHASRLDRRFQGAAAAPGIRRRAGPRISGDHTVRRPPAFPSLGPFLEQVEYNGRRLAKLNLRARRR